MTLKPTIEANKATSSVLTSSEWNTDVLQEANYVDEVLAGTNTDKIPGSALANPLTVGAVSGTTGSFSGAVSGTTGTFTGAAKSNSNPVVEGTAAVTHSEVYPPQGSASVLAGGNHAVLFTFARAFTTIPMVTANCDTTNVTAQGVEISYSRSLGSVTVTYWNNDISTQTLSNFGIIAEGI